MLRVLGQSQRTIALELRLRVRADRRGGQRCWAWLIGYAVHFVFVAAAVGPGRGRRCRRAGAAGRWLFGLGMGLTLLFAFGLPPVLQLAQVPPLRVIRRDVGNLKPASLAVLAVGVVGFAALLLAASSDLLLGGIAVGGFAGAVAGVRRAELAGRQGCCAGRSTRPPRRAGWCWPRARSRRARPTRWCRSARWRWACWRWCCWCCCAPT